MALNYLRRGGKSDVFNCGYSHGFSVLEVIESVKRVTGVDFPVDNAERRAGDPPALIAESSKLRQTLGWQPELDDLDTIVGHAFTWEQALNQVKAAS